MISKTFQRKRGKLFWESTVLLRQELTPLTNRVCVFAHYHPSEITNDVIHYLKAIQSANWSIIFVTTGETLPSSSFSVLSKVCSMVIQRNNIGYDFGSYVTGFYNINTTQTTNLLFCNDSVYGPFHPLLEIEAEMNSFDFWGITDSNERSHHLQSYYLHFNQNSIQSDDFHKFIDNISPQKNKRKLIKKYEIGFTEKLKRAGFNYGSFISSKEILSKYSKEHSAHSNVSIHFPYELLQARMPFVKKQVIRSNPGNKDLTQIQRLLAQYDLN